jgi:hypothetical protein
MTYPVGKINIFFYNLFIYFFCIKVVRSSTNKLQDVYAKAKDTSVLIRFPCNFAETIADKSLKIAFTVANPLVQPLRGSGKLKFFEMIFF